MKISPVDLELDISSEPIFRPYKISEQGMKDMFKDVPESVKVIARDLRDNHGWRYYATEQTRGRCYYRSKVITIPLWVINYKDTGRKIQYICHELAHALVGWKVQSHGDVFMAKLIEICPEEHLHWELDYKPRNARRAGITIHGV